MHDVIVIGAGHNALVAATLLGRAGLKVLVLERSDRPGGCLRMSELAAGFKCPTLTHAAAIEPAIVRELRLDTYGLKLVTPEAIVCAPTGDRALTLWRDEAETARELRAFSAADAERYPKFLESFRRISHVTRALSAATPPSIDDPSPREVFDVIKAIRAFRRLGKADAYRLLRWLPMAVADLVGEWFESEPLRATIAAGGVLGAFLGPWSAGSAAVLLWLGAGEGRPIPGWYARGGAGALAGALVTAARQAGVEIRAGTNVTSIAMNGDAAAGVVLDNGEQLTCRIVVSGADPKRTFLGLIDPAYLDPEFTRRIQNIRAHGTLAKINFAISALPTFAGLKSLGNAEQVVALSGRVRLGRDIDTIERAFDAAKYGRFSEEPWIELRIPSIADPSLAPTGQHVVSAYVQYAPYHLRGTNWDDERDRLANVATQTIDRAAPGFAASVIARETITPLDLERTYALSGGHIFHGELALDQLFITRPTLGWAQYATPVRNLFLCGNGTHPGTGATGQSGALAARTILRDLKTRK